MIVDTSAVVALLLEEQGATRVRSALTGLDGGARAMSASSYVELGVVIDRRRKPALSRKVDALVSGLDIEVVPFDAEQARVARQAYRDFGRGSGHPARLNFGDCFSYALASVRREPLLFVGGGFGHTDVRSVL
ncbi:type II toxin-antitoxin system VapC family toxin [Microlunatus flavus]|uniref:Ribonuclease VapC n=1 Tax=Microlunatus flavus TaxID=1036181 RepID=A0A1H8ZA88_9ACTN|nr:type II toxin-antitoxin system VapC family toxin [Microlunatus flavus]SEP61167.1 ribonuclease VapC [Microlunatus flavus]